MTQICFLKGAWRLQYLGAVCDPDWQDRGGALAALSLLESDYYRLQAGRLVINREAK